MEYMTDIKVIDNVLDEEYFFQLQSHMTSDHWPWFFMNNITSVDDGQSNYGFFHMLKNEHGESKRYESVKELVQTISKHVGSDHIIRCRMDMTVNRGKSCLCEPHVDLTQPHITTIFYVNDSDGNTVIYNEMYDMPPNVPYMNMHKKLTIKQEIQPKANRLLIFNGLHMHTGHTPTTCNQRVLINSNFR